jgi:polyisoprenyl-teichoic acid--peptidoglycan teichoic acid transferase
MPPPPPQFPPPQFPPPPPQYPQPSRARRSQYQPPRRRRLRSVIGAILVIALVVAGGVGAYRVAGFLHSVGNVDNPVDLIKGQIEPPAGSIAYKIKHGERINILALGYGGAENDAPWLTDSIMAISIDPAGKRVVETSIPRDLYVRIDAWQDGRVFTEKINAAFQVPNSPKLFAPGPLKPAYQGKDGAGHLAEATVGRITGMTFDKYMAVDFKAFRDVVDALGGVQVHMDGPLDDCHYPNYTNGYVNHGVPPGYRCPPGAGIHFKSGSYVVNGEQALQLARSRDASEPEQATDFARAKRQQMIISAIKKKAISAGAIARAPQLMDALQANFRTDMDINDVKALYDFGGKLPDTAIQHLAITDQDLAVGYVPYAAGSCGPRAAYVLCPVDPTYRIWQSIFARVLVPPPTLAEQAPVQLVNASNSLGDMQSRTTLVLRQVGFQLADGVRHAPMTSSVIFDYSGGKYPQTAAWLQDFFGAQVVPATTPSPGVRGSFVPAPGERTDGLVVVMGSDFARRWIGQA